jgi:tetratricopeptide (TPR) repeat protein
LTFAGRIDEAIAEYREALRLRPEYAQAHNNLGGILFRLGRLDEAQRHLGDAVRIDPSSADARDNLGRLHAHRKDVTAAIAQFREAIRLRPEWAAPHAELAWLLATAPGGRGRDPAEAVALASRAAQLTGERDQVALDVLAAAHAAAGDFGRAIEIAEAALKLAPDSAAAPGIRDRLAAYRQNRSIVLP